MSFISQTYNFLVNLSPQSEVFFRKLYWKYVKVFKNIKPSEQISKDIKNIDFSNITGFLKESGIGDDDIMIVHSSYDSLAGSGLDPESVIDKLMEIIPNGTLAMPAIRRFEDDCKYEDYISTESYESTSTYDVWNSQITSGMLPFVMMRYDDAFVSRCPLNPLVALGTKAEEMMKQNIETEKITVHGEGSCWDYCAKNDAWNVGLGIELKGFLTIHHVFQESENWPVKDWFFKRKFLVKDGKFRKEIEVYERRHVWTKYLAENHFYKDLIDAGVIKTREIDGLMVYVCKTSALENFIKNHRNKAYPYYIPRSSFHEKR